MVCLDAIVNEQYEYNGTTPPCPENTAFKGQAYYYNCKTWLNPNHVSCSTTIMEYISVRCDRNRDAVGHCAFYTVYCWEEDPITNVYVLITKYIGPIAYGNIECYSKNWLFIVGWFATDNSCFGRVIDDLRNQFLEKFKNGSIGSGACAGLTGQYLEDCITAECADNPNIFKDFLDALLTAPFANDCCPEYALYEIRAYLLRHFPDGNITCEGSCY